MRTLGEGPTALSRKGSGISLAASHRERVFARPQFAPTPGSVRPRYKHLEERLSMRCLAEHLRKRLPRKDVRWRSERDDPPDFWLRVAGTRFAVEVTKVVEILGQHPTRYSSLGLKHLYTYELPRAIEVRARDHGCLCGKYWLTVSRAPRIDRTAIVAKAAQYIRRTKQDREGAAVLLHKDRSGILEIQKHSGDGASVLLATWARGMKWEGLIRDQLTALLEDCVCTKRRKLEKKGVPLVCSNIVLVLDDEYRFADLPIYLECIRQVQGVDWFHSIFWVRSRMTPGKTTSQLAEVGCFLTTKEKGWASSDQPED